MAKEENRVEKAEIRRLAEAALASSSREEDDLSKFSLEDMKHLVHELRVHQVELNMQNEELRRVQGELEASRNRYSHLYDFAPVGYFTISHKGIILEANLTGATMLGEERGLLAGTPFHDYIHRDDQNIFYLFRVKLIETRRKQTCNLRLTNKNGSDFHAQMECIPVFKEDGDLDRIRTIAIDITTQYEAALKQRESEARYLALLDNMKDGVAG